MRRQTRRKMKRKRKLGSATMGAKVQLQWVMLLHLTRDVKVVLLLRCVPPGESA